MAELHGLYYYTYYAFEQCSQKLPIMLNIMPITTPVMPQFIYNSIIFNDYISIVGLQADVFYIMLCCSVLIFDVFSHEKTCTSFCIMLAWLLYCYHKTFI